MSREYFIENCSQCGSPLKPWDVEIRKGYKCFKCKHPMRIMLIYKPEEEQYNRIIQSEFAYDRHPSMIPLAAEFGVLLEKRYSKEVKNSYVAHICPKCKIIQGDYYVVEDNHQKTELVSSFKGLACSSCKHWEPVKVSKVAYKVEHIINPSENSSEEIIRDNMNCEHKSNIIIEMLHKYLPNK